MDIYTKSKIKKITLLKINAEKLEAPSKETALKVGIGIGMNFNDKKTDLGYEITYSLTINCDENGDKKLCALDYKTVVTYEIDGDAIEIEKGFKKEHGIFVRELYNMTREYLNDVLYKMKVRLQLPLTIPENFIHNMEVIEEDEKSNL